MTRTTPGGVQPGVCLLTPAILTEENMAGMVTLALSHTLPEVIILTEATGERAHAGRLRELRAVAKRHGKVFLVENDIELAQELEAEGMLLAGLDDFGAAKQAIGDDATIGILCGLSRHTAMEAGEAGADFVGLGEPGGNSGTEVNLAGHIVWWSSIFEIPSVAFGIKSMGDAETILGAGADFLALGDPFWNHNNMVELLDTLWVGADTK